MNRRAIHYLDIIIIIIIIQFRGLIEGPLSVNECGVFDHFKSSNWHQIYEKHIFYI